ncbi:MAG: TetR/AcrR family transcriptional regulator [Sulfurimonas sp.]|jgi:TetR/AcrR family transcriptional repressor of nem operon|nr:TetR/AcrR family transcriptional regulator [Sulfurimonas sp.]MDD3060523.1 TetR/AcrR family transcriptional regulator [Sulfurimonas sp.]MDD5203263.1 TetR/AcrR family transcriptional regulator [Sulfurimonas sp.]
MKKNTRDLILDSALEVIYKYGFQGSNIDLILEKAKIKKGSMYHFFKSKKELGLAVINEKIRQNLQVKYTTILDSQTPFDDLFFVLFNAPSTLEYGCPLNKISQEMIYIDTEFNKILSDVYQDFESLIQKILIKSINAGQISACESDKNAKLIIATYEGGLMIYHLNKNQKSYEDIIMSLKNSF